MGDSSKKGPMKDFLFKQKWFKNYFCILTPIGSFMGTLSHICTGKIGFIKKGMTFLEFSPTKGIHFHNVVLQRVRFCNTYSQASMPFDIATEQKDLLSMIWLHSFSF